MVGASASSRRDVPKKVVWEEFLRDFLTVIFQDAARNNRFLSPEAALWQLDEFLDAIARNKEREKPKSGDQADAATRRLPLLSGISVTRAAYRIAVDLCFSTYFSVRPQRGRPRLTSEDLEPIKELRKKGLSWSQIVELLGLPHETSDEQRQSMDKLRKRLTSVQITRR